jgi:hypothetical protein
MSSFLVLLDVKGYDFSNIYCILPTEIHTQHRGCLDLADSATHTMPELDALFVTVKLSLLLATNSFDSEINSDKLRIHF